MILEVMATGPEREWTTQEVVQGLRTIGHDAKSKNISGELARMNRIGDVRMTHRGKGRWDGSRWTIAK